jgi:myo-inositol-hexaphosphate 3-phosphohydrolase
VPPITALIALALALQPPPGLPPPPTAPRPEQIDPLGPDDVRPVVIHVPAPARTLPLRRPADLALWIDHADPTRSLLFAADHDAILWFDLDGNPVGHEPLPSPSAVDGRPNAPLAGTRLDLLTAASETDGLLRLWTIDRPSRRLRPAGTIETELQGVSALALRLDEANTRTLAYVADAQGQILRLTLSAQSRTDGTVEVRGEVTARLLPEGPVSGMVADDARATLYVARAESGLWRYDDDATNRPRGRRIDRAGGGRLSQRLGALALLSRGDKGFMISVSEGDGTLAVYQRSDQNPYVCSIRVFPDGTKAAGTIRGLEATTRLGPPWSGGLIAVGYDSSVALLRWTDLVDRSGLPLALPGR